MTMTTTHTPGPWTAEYSTYGDEIWFGGEGPGMWTIDAPGVYMSGCEGSATAKADARLIAAAPDLLAALETLMGLIEMTGPRCISDYAHPISAARAAIAKAKGE